MRASRTSPCRLIQYHADNLAFDGAVALQKQIVSFVRGVRGVRQTPVTEWQIVDYFRATDPAFVRRQLTEVCGDGRVRIYPRSLSSSRKYNGGYIYEAAEVA
jgi:hypothetical protein